MAHKIVCLIIAGVILAGSIAMASDAGKVASALSTAEKWLATVDAGKYSASWKEASELFRDAAKQEQWEQSMQATRKPLGNLVSRKVQTKTFKTTLPGAPDGEYVLIQFETSFENKKTAIETVTPMLDKDGKWRGAGYYIK